MVPCLLFSILLFRSSDFAGDCSDVKRITRQVMNRCASQRVLSKQEATVLLADMDLYSCSETIVSLSISDSCRVSLSSDDKFRGNRSFLQQYKTRDTTYENMSLHDYFHLTRNHDENRAGNKFSIPHFVGCNSQATFPVTESYARHVLIVHKPWRIYPRNVDWIFEFERFINSDMAPLVARLEYQRVVARYVDNMTFYEAKASNTETSNDGIGVEDKILMDLAGLNDTGDYDLDDALIKSLDMGLNFDWGKIPKVSDIENALQDFDPLKIFLTIFVS